jgi:hypothetical protein
MLWIAGGACRFSSLSDGSSDHLGQCQRRHPTPRR